MKRKLITLAILALSFNAFTQNNNTGFIKGLVSYPGDGIPTDYEIKAVNISTGKVFSTKKFDLKSLIYTLKVDTGQYYIYATEPDAPDYRVYYSEWVKCGASANCLSHKILIIKVGPNQTIKNVDMTDWYCEDWATEEKGLPIIPKSDKNRIIVESSVNNQNIKVYNGDYTLNEINAVGTAKYSYYENENYQRVYHGDFTLSVGKGNFSCVITGKFKNDMRDGMWTAKGNFGYPQNFDFLITENYINGQPNGIWTATSKRGDKIIEYDKRVLSNGLFIDTWELFSLEQKIQMKLELDKNGFFIESDITTQGKTQNISKFIAGYEVLTVTKDVQTGESNVKRVDDQNIIENLKRIERYLKIDPDSLLDIPYKLKTNSGIDEMGTNVDISYLLNFTKDIRGAVLYNGHQFYGLYHTELTEQKTREQIRIEEERKIAAQKAEEEKRIAEEKLAEEKRLLEEKKKRLYDEASKITDISTFDNNLYQSILSDIDSNCRLFLSNMVKDKYISPLSFTFTPSFTWTPKEIIGSRYEYAKNVTPYLYYQPNYSIDKSSVPESFTIIFEIDRLANIEKEFEGQKFKMTVSAKYKEIKIEYITSQVSIKLNKEKEINWLTEISEHDKKLIEEKIKQLEKGKYSLNYRIGLLNENAVAVTIEQI